MQQRREIGGPVLVGRGRVARVRRREGAAGRLVRRARARDPRDHRPERRRQELDAQRDQRRLPPAAGQDHVTRARPGPTWTRHEAAALGIARTFQNIALFKGMTRARQHHDRAQPEDALQLPAAGGLVRAGEARGDRAPAQGRGDHRLPRDPAHPQDAGRAAALRPAEARRARAARSPPSRSCCCSTSRWRA